MTKTTWPIAIFLCLFFSPGFLNAGEFRHLNGVIHLQTSFDGAGAHSLQELILMAKQKGIEVLIPTDHDLQVMTYGIAPFRNLIRRREERPSVIKIGPDKFLAEISRVNQMQDDVLVIPGVQSSPFYYWSGNPLSKNLSANDYRKELLLIGMQSPEDYAGLPVLHRGFSTRYTKELLGRSFLFLGALLISLYLFFQKGILRKGACIIGVLSIIMLIDQHPFRSSKFDPYHGDQGIAPFQELIDYVNERGGMVFWAHPESNYAVNGVQLGPVKLMTKHYPEDLLESTGYTGFEAIYGDTITATDPGMQWDRVLLAYCRGEREKPTWGISGADFRESRTGERIDEFQNVFLVREKTHREVLDALSKGRMVAVRKGKKVGLVLNRFVVKNENTGHIAEMGQTLNLKGIPLVEVSVSADDGGKHPIDVVLVRGGEIVKSFRDVTPLSFRFHDSDRWKKKTYYRLEARGNSNIGRLLTNPIFVSR
jgi:hypothetical protein